MAIATVEYNVRTQQYEVVQGQRIIKCCQSITEARAIADGATAAAMKSLAEQLKNRR